MTNFLIFSNVFLIGKALFISLFFFFFIEHWTHLKHCRSASRNAAVFSPWWSRTARNHVLELRADNTRGRRPRPGTGKTGTRDRTSAGSWRSSAASCAYNFLHHYTHIHTNPHASAFSQPTDWIFFHLELLLFLRVSPNVFSSSSRWISKFKLRHLCRRIFSFFYFLLAIRFENLIKFEHNNPFDR